MKERKESRLFLPKWLILNKMANRQHYVCKFWLSFAGWVTVKLVPFLNMIPDQITGHLNFRKCILNMSGICDRHFLHFNKIKVYSYLYTIRSLLPCNSRAPLGVTFSSPKIQNPINSISICQVLTVSKIWCWWFCEWICKSLKVPVSPGLLP